MLDKMFPSRNKKTKSTKPHKKKNNVPNNTDRKKNYKVEKVSLLPLSETKLRLYRNILLLVAILLDLYSIASYFRFYTGEMGYLIQKYIIFYGGGGAVVLLFFVLYYLVALLLNRPITQFTRQLVATLLVYVDASIVLVLYNISDFTIPPKLYPWINAGLPGYWISHGLLKFAGTFGTILVGFATILTALWLLDFFPYENIKNILFHNKRRSVERTSELSQYDESPGTFTGTSSKGSKNKEKNVVVRKHKGQQVEQFLLNESFTDNPETSKFVEEEITSIFSNPNEKLTFAPDVEQGVFPPPLEILGPESSSPEKDLSQEIINQKSINIIDTLKEFNVEAQMAEVIIGPTVIQFRLQLAPGIKVSKVAALTNDLAVALGVASLRVEAPIPGTTYVGVEIPNPKRKPVHLRSIIKHQPSRDVDGDLPIAIGASVDGKPLIVPLEKLPHLLVAGTTGSGKSVFISSCITSLCYTRRPEEMRLLLIDPKRVEMKMFEKIPHALMPPIVESKKAVHALAWAVTEMERRYEKFAQARARDLKSYNAKVMPKDKLPYIVIIIDELADLMFTAPKEVEDYICRLAQMARATGMHLIIATQRPSVNVVTGLIKANIPARVAFTLPSQTDSRTIIDVAGAEKLLGSGDMLFLTPRLSKPIRIQAPMINETSVTNFIEYLIRLFGEPEYIDIETLNDSQPNGILESYDPLLEQALEIIMQTGIASASRLQRQLRIGFTRAARLIDILESLGIVSAPDGAKPRDILVDHEEAKQILEEHTKRDGI